MVESWVGSVAEEITLRTQLSLEFFISNISIRINCNRISDGLLYYVSYSTSFFHIFRYIIFNVFLTFPCVLHAFSFSEADKILFLLYHIHVDPFRIFCVHCFTSKWKNVTEESSSGTTQVCKYRLRPQFVICRPYATGTRSPASMWQTSRGQLRPHYQSEIQWAPAGPCYVWISRCTRNQDINACLFYLQFHSSSRS
jgi:hypothetical protein